MAPDPREPRTAARPATLTVVLLAVAGFACLLAGRSREHPTTRSTKGSTALPATAGSC